MITQEHINSLRWYHDFDFPNGLQARSIQTKEVNREYHRKNWEFITRNLATVDMKGKSVIDIGCWDGYFSFIAEEMGAKSVLATDDYSQNWGARDSLMIVKELKNSNITPFSNLSVYDLSTKMQEKFDVIIFVGVYYHLHSAYLALAQVRTLCHEDTVVVIEGDCIRDEEKSYANIILDNPSVPKFRPSNRLIKDMITSCYFEIQHIDFMSGLSAEQVKSPDMVDRILVIAKPFKGVNKQHFYRPVFGLDQFDTRWSS